MSDTTSLANMPYTDPPTDDQYRAAARTLAHLSGGDTEGLRTALEAIGHPDAQPAPKARPRKRPNGNTGPSARCSRDLHDMTPDNVSVNASGRRCRACRNAGKRRRERGEK